MLPRSKVIPLGRTRVIPTRLAGNDLTFDVYDPYEKLLLDMFNPNVVSLWPMTDRDGNTARNSITSMPGGVYENCRLSSTPGPTGIRAPYFSGLSSMMYFYSSAFNTKFNGSTGSAFVWTKFEDVSLWTDGVNQYQMYIRVDGSNYIIMNLTNTNNQIRFQYRAGGAAEINESSSPYSFTNWFNLGISWSQTDTRYYINGTQVGVMDTTLGVWAGNLDPAYCVFGHNSHISGSTHRGWMQYALILNRIVAPQEALNIYTMINL